MFPFSEHSNSVNNKFFTDWSLIPEIGGFVWIYHISVWGGKLQEHKERLVKCKIFTSVVENWVSEGLLLNANSAIFHISHGANKSIFEWEDDEVHFVPDQRA